MKRKPLTKIPDGWTPLTYGESRNIRETTPGFIGGWRLKVHDGRLLALYSEDPGGYHLSISFTEDRGRFKRYPTWDEIADAREELTPPSVEFVMFLPKPEHYVALHDTCFHLHEYPERKS